MKKKILAVLLSAAMVAAMAMGCSSGGGSSAKSDGESKGKAEDIQRNMLQNSDVQNRYLRERLDIRMQEQHLYI